MPKKRTYPKSAEAFNAFIRKHGLEDLSKLEERLEVGKGYLRYYVSKGTARLREISMFRLSALAGISGIDPDLAAGYKADVTTARPLKRKHLIRGSYGLRTFGSRSE